MTRRLHGVKLYPRSTRDRIAVWIGVGTSAFDVYVAAVANDPVGYSFAVLFGLGAAILFVAAYVFQDRREDGGGSEYAEMIGELDKTREVLETLTAFLERERVRVNQAEQTVNRLNAERAALEPVVTTDRETVNAILPAVWIGVGTSAFDVYVAAVANDPVGYSFAVLFGLGAAILFVAAYVFQDRREDGGGSEYAEMIGELDKTREVLETLTAFLERERVRVNQAEQTVNRLNAERAALEPVVTTDRETVNAILSAHTSMVRAHAWKDRLLGFGIGVMSSLVAAAILLGFGIGQ